MYTRSINCQFWLKMSPHWISDFTDYPNPWLLTTSNNVVEHRDICVLCLPQPNHSQSQVTTPAVSSMNVDVEFMILYFTTFNHLFIQNAHVCDTNTHTQPWHGNCELNSYICCVFTSRIFPSERNELCSMSSLLCVNFAEFFTQFYCMTNSWLTTAASYLFHNKIYSCEWGRTGGNFKMQQNDRRSRRQHIWIAETACTHKFRNKFIFLLHFACGDAIAIAWYATRSSIKLIVDVSWIRKNEANHSLPIP